MDKYPDTLEIRVTAEHLNKAIAQRNDPKNHGGVCATCMMAVAVQEQFDPQGQHGYEFIYDSSLDPVYACEAAADFVRAFDQRRYAELRNLLPHTFTYKRVETAK